jgi:hypothetical protein
VLPHDEITIISYEREIRTQASRRCRAIADSLVLIWDAKLEEHVCNDEFGLGSNEMSLFSAVYEVLCEGHVVVGNADDTLENVGVPTRGLGPFWAREVEQHRRVVPFDLQDKLFSRA